MLKQTKTMKTKTLTLLVVLALLIVPTAAAYTDATVLRQNNGNDISPATQNTPLFQINQANQYYGGTNNQDFIQLVNNYDETLSVTVTLSDDNWAFSDGSTTKTYTLQEGETIQTVIDTKGNRDDTCDKTNTYSYTYSVSGDTLNTNQVTNQVTICGGSGGNGGGPPGGGPPGGGPPGQ